MAMTLNEPVRLCKIITSGPVTVLGGIAGPINKCKLTNKQIVAAIRSGHKVAEYNPENPSEFKLLKLDDNCASPFVKKPEPPVEAPKAPKKAKPVVVEEKKPEPPVEVPPVVEEPVPEVVAPVEEAPVVVEAPVVEVPSEEVVAEVAPAVEEEVVKSPIEEEAPEVPEEIETAPIAADKKVFVIDTNPAKKGKKSKK